MILVGLIMLTSLVSAEPCDPYGVRLFFGHYFSYLRNSQDVIRVVFNTKTECQNNYILEITDNQQKNQSQLDFYETELLNMTQIYENNATLHYNYETWIHTFKIGMKYINLKSSTEYNYTILNQQLQILAGPFTFDVPLARQDQKILVFGDMDSNWDEDYSKPTYNWLINEIKKDSKYDTILFTGDMAYDLESKNCQQGDNWIRGIQEFACRYPFMAVPGNHDQGNNTFFDYFRANFKSLYLKEYNTINYLNDFASFDVGYMHIIQFNPLKATYQRDTNNITPFIVDQMKNDLIMANKNRDIIPWIVVYAHYPIYCAEEGDQCLNNYKYLSSFEDLFVEYKVDLYLSGHQHNYERNKPYYKNKEANYQVRDVNVFYNYNAPVSVIEGIAGTEHGSQNNSYESKPFMVFQNPEHGVGVITIKNKTHLYYEHITVGNNKVIDSFWIDRESENIETTEKDLFVVIMWIIFALLMVITAVSVYQKCSKTKKTTLYDDITLTVE